MLKYTLSMLDFKTKRASVSKVGKIVVVKTDDEAGLDADAVLVQFLDGFDVVGRAVDAFAGIIQGFFGKAFQADQQSQAAGFGHQLQYFFVPCHCDGRLTDPLNIVGLGHFQQFLAMPAAADDVVVHEKNHVFQGEPFFGLCAAELGKPFFL